MNNKNKSNIFKNILNYLNTLPENRIILFIFIASILIAIISGFKYYDRAPSGDATYYYNAAKIIKEKPIGWVSDKKIGVLESLNAIIQGYLILLPGDDFINVYIFQILLYAITSILIYLTSRHLLKPVPSLVVILFYLFNNKHWEGIYNFKPAVWVNLFLIFCIYESFQIVREPQKKYFILLGISSGLLLLTDLRYIPHLFLIYFVLLFVKKGFCLNLKSIFMSILLAILIITPWVIRQSIVFNKFVLVSDIHQISIEHILNSSRIQELYEHKFLSNLSEEEFNNKFWEICDSLDLSPGELIYARNLNINRGTSLELKSNLLLIYLKRALFFWEPFRFSYEFDPYWQEAKIYPPAGLLSNINRIVFFGSLLPFFIVGLILLWRRKIFYAAISTGILFSHTIVHMLTYLQWRYMLPVLPLITIIAIYGIVEIITYSKKKITFINKK